MSLQVLIVDDHEAARYGLGNLLEHRGFIVSDSFGSGEEAIAAICSTNGVAAKRYDVILLDVRMPTLDGLATLEQIRESVQTPVVMLSSYENPTYIARAAALGAQDYLLKSEVAERICDCLMSVSEGQSAGPDSRMTTIESAMRMPVDTDSLPSELPLTGREAQVLRHIALGLSNKETARSLEISVETVKEHVQNILRKTKAVDRTDAAVRAIKLGLID